MPSDRVAEFFAVVAYLLALVKILLIDDDDRGNRVAFPSSTGNGPVVTVAYRPQQSVGRDSPNYRLSTADSKVSAADSQLSITDSEDQKCFRSYMRGSFAGNVTRVPDQMTTSNNTRSKATFEEESEMEEGTEWSNKADEIIRSEVGLEEYRKRRDKQEKLFEKGCEKGNIFDMFSMFMATSKLKSIFEKKTKKNKQRATHTSGIGALGYIVFDPAKDVPENGFMLKNRVLEIRARHSNFPDSADDTKVGWRSLSLKFADHDKVSPLDLIMETGETSLLFNADAVEELHTALDKGATAVKEFFTSLPAYLSAAIEGMRKRPDSYYHQFYHSQMVYDFFGKDSTKRVARFRIKPSDGSMESGRLTHREQREAWYSMLLEHSDDQVPDNYLKEEFRTRMKNGSINYDLEIQHRSISTDDTNMIYNPALAWPEAVYPWLKVGAITLTSILPDDVTEATRFNVGNCPPATLGFPEGTSVYDFNIVPNLRKEIYEYCAKLRPDKPLEIPSAQLTDYLIHFVTGSQADAGNMDQNCNIYVCLVGTLARTRYIKIVRKFKTDFDKCSKITYTIRDKSIGELVCVKVFKDRKGVKTEWFLEYIVLTTPYNNKCYTLPCYRWLTDQVPIVVLRDGTANLDSQDEEHYLRLMRNMEVAEKQRLCAWHEQKPGEDFYGFPGYISAGIDLSQLPKDVRSSLDDKKIEKEWKEYVKDASSLLKTMLKLFRSDKLKLDDQFEAVISDLDSKITRSYNLEHIFKHWRNDDEFARQMLNGLNPQKIKRISQLPVDFQVTETMVKDYLQTGKTLAKELSAGNIFLVEYKELEDFASLDAILGGDQSEISNSDSLEANKEKKSTTSKETKEKKGIKSYVKFLCAPKVLLYNNNGTLLPLAIQLTRPTNQHESQVIYTKADDTNHYSDWLVAKMWVKVADANSHQFSTHILGTHLFVEPVAIAMIRNLPSAHPVFKLLFPHLEDIITTNAIYRKLIIGADGMLGDVMALGQNDNHLAFIRKSYAAFDFPPLNVPDDFEQRGVVDSKALPTYYYRDDSLKLWKAIHDFVTDIIALYYDDDEVVENDGELSHFLRDLSQNGFHNKAGLPDKFTSAEELVNFLTAIVFRCSVQHTAVNAGQFDVYGFVPNAPPCMAKPVPTRRRPEGWTEIEIKALLPQTEIVEKYIALSMIFSKPSDDKETLGNYSLRLFTEERAQSALKKFRKKLQQISTEIITRNEKLECPYEYLLPEKVANKIDV